MLGHHNRLALLHALEIAAQAVLELPDAHLHDVAILAGNVATAPPVIGPFPDNSPMAVELRQVSTSETDGYAVTTRLRDERGSRGSARGSWTHPPVGPRPTRSRRAAR